ncbi:acetyl-CoA carboxylase, carboxyltransferase subunit beta [Ferruginibacter yonginensis]|uniref:Acetyl-coenzyme A carboxylase carboxyl transferase subunit beta n=1 Tax=Ferruginibacter yonginensis TaxID=1310416 RepID=A0ABV8QM75_9BACT
MNKVKEDDFEATLTGESVENGVQHKSSWFKRIKKGILTSTKDKKDAPEGLWEKCPNCKYTCTVSDLAENKFVCPKCEFHHRIGSDEYFDMLFDEGSYTELFANIKSKDYLGFVDLKPYDQRLIETYKKTEIHDSITVAHGKTNGHDFVVACMDFEFIGGSLGSVMGEKISRACDYCMEHRIPFMIINKSGGARMMESAFSLMQLAKTSGKLNQLAEAKIPYISLCTDPTFGGTTASFAMLGDVICGEPGALIGFAGPRVIKETIKKDLPDGFQRSEFLLEHGFLDFIVHRKDLKEKMTNLLVLFKN